MDAKFIAEFWLMTVLLCQSIMTMRGKKLSQASYYIVCILLVTGVTTILPRGENPKTTLP